MSWKPYIYHDVLYDRATWKWKKSAIVLREHADVFPCGDTDRPDGTKREFIRRPELDPDYAWTKARRDMAVGDIVQVTTDVHTWSRTGDPDAIAALSSLTGSCSIKAGSLLRVTTIGHRPMSADFRYKVEVAELWLPVGREGFLLQTHLSRAEYRFWKHPPLEGRSSENLTRRYSVPVFEAL